MTTAWPKVWSASAVCICGPGNYCMRGSRLGSAYMAGQPGPVASGRSS
jgi:hypothetical protein